MAAAKRARAGGADVKCVLYVRVSTDQQTVDNQIPQLEEYAKLRGWDVVGVYSENESAWRAGHQAELARLKQRCRHNGAGHPDIVLTWALDRLTREGSAAILNLVNEFKLFGVRVVSLQESWTEAPGELAEVLFAIAGWVARMESKRRSERTKAGLDRLRKVGKKLGRPLGSQDKKKRQKRVARIHAQYLTPGGGY